MTDRKNIVQQLRDQAQLLLDREAITRGQRLFVAGLMRDAADSIESQKAWAMTNRILWNRRPTGPSDCGDIDEIVLHGVTVHIEQMDDRCWWIGLMRPDGARWSGTFSATSRGRMTFGEQENDGIVWEHDATHEGEA